MKCKKIISLLGLTPILAVVPNTILTSCNKTDRVTTLYNSALNGFYEWCKIPHPTGTSADPRGYYDLARPYLTNKARKLGASVQRDEYGNIWFDIPATKGYEKCQKIILQGHMDMVVAGMTEEQAKTTGIVPEITKDADNREILHSKDYKTSLGADDGVAIATIFALLNDSSVQHGPLRILFTVDEETGEGAKHLDKSAIDSHLLFSLDAEGNKDMENIVCVGTGGILGGNLTPKNITYGTPTLTNKIKITTSGFSGGRVTVTTKYTKEQGVCVSGNADKFIFEILNYLITQKNKKVEIAFINDNPTEQPQKASELPVYCDVRIATDASKDDVTEAINKVKTLWKTLYKNEDWDNKVKCEISSVDPTFSKVVSIEQSKTIISNLGSIIQCAPTSANDFEGDSHEEKANKNYATIINNFNSFAIDADTGKASWKEVGYASTIGKMKIIEKWTRDIWNSVFGDESLDVKTDTKVWDGSSKPDAINYSLKCFDKINVKASTMKPPLRFFGECSDFETQNCVSELHQVQLGPRMDNTHTVKETLYLDTFKTFVNLMLTIVENVNTL